MRYTMTLLERDFEQLRNHLTSTANETAAYLLGGLSVTPSETRILIREVHPVVPTEIESASPRHLSIRSTSYARAIKKSRELKTSFVFIHSHPSGPDDFSPQDDREEPPLFQLAHFRNQQPAHASLVLSNGNRLIGRVWLADGTTAPLERIRVLGDRWRFMFSGTDGEAVPEYFDRQVRAFGSEIQKLLKRLHIGVIGAGGTGSAVMEQLIRLGVGKITIVDNQRLEASNVNRVYGSSTFDDGASKTALLARLGANIGLHTDIEQVPRHLSYKTVAQALRDCDIIFGCTDDEWGRSILTRLAVYYLIPVLDLGVLIDPHGEQIRSIQGRVTMLAAGVACLFCRERITSARVAAESITATDPNRATELRAEGYIAGVEAPAPSVIAFTSGVASAAVAEVLARLTAFKGDDPRPTELIYRFDQDGIGGNARSPKADCFCADKDLWGAGDRKPFLGVTWRAE